MSQGTFQAKGKRAQPCGMRRLVRGCVGLLLLPDASRRASSLGTSRGRGLPASSCGTPRGSLAAKNLLRPGVSLPNANAQPLGEPVGYARIGRFTQAAGTPGRRGQPITLTAPGTQDTRRRDQKPAPSRKEHPRQVQIRRATSGSAHLAARRLPQLLGVTKGHYCSQNCRNLVRSNRLEICAFDGNNLPSHGSYG